MPFPPLPPNNSPRYFFDYTTGNTDFSQVHTCAWRTVDEGINAVNVQLKFLAFLNAIGAANLRDGWAVTGLRYQEAGSIFTVPVALDSGLAAFEGTGTPAEVAYLEALEWVWSARSPVSGRKVDFSLYGLTVDVSSTFRYTPGDAEYPLFVSNTIGVLVSAPLGTPVTIDMQVPTWYNYINVQWNSYWERKLRA